jgi:hypothetical protein
MVGLSFCASGSTRVLEPIRGATSSYPRPFWILFWGSLVNSAGASMVWPFLTIYVRELLSVPLTTGTLLFAANSVAGGCPYMTQKRHRWVPLPSVPHA